MNEFYDAVLKLILAHQEIFLIITAYIIILAIVTLCAWRKKLKFAANRFCNTIYFCIFDLRFKISEWKKQISDFKKRRKKTQEKRNGPYAHLEGPILLIVLTLFLALDCLFLGLFQL
ncbi:hypothetical protein K8R32_04380 [bacterium]|nr:hypothetical protein [bacterium]